MIYDLEIDGKFYPPILVLSEASIIAGGSELFLRDFGNSTKKAFKILENLGFMVSNKEVVKPKMWFVAQGDTFTDDIGKKYLWAPLVDVSGKTHFYWDNMLKVKKGDIIFNYSKGLKAISIAKSECFESNNPYKNSQWGQKGRRIDIECYELARAISAGEIKANKEKFDKTLIDVQNKPFDVNGKVNQGYLYEFSIDAGNIIYSLFGETIGSEYIDSILTFTELLTYPPRSSEVFTTDKLFKDILKANLKFTQKLVSRFCASLITKPFLILTGLSGSGKTKLAQAFAQWICRDNNQYCIVPVGADWTNREPLLGYPNALKPGEYVKPDNGALDVIIKANKNPELPYLLILDEMNLSHVERYFADFLSVMESKDNISLFAEGTISNGVEAKLSFPSNLFIIGTVNIDETTYMFSPKVLDRANVIEFRVSKGEMQNFFASQTEVDMDKLEKKGATMAHSFLKMAEKIEFEEQDLTEIHKTLVSFFEQLKKTGAEFGYRSATEIIRLIKQLTVIDSNLSADEKLDIAIMQKLLPKLHGSRRKLCPVLITLGGFCVNTAKIPNIEKDVFMKENFDFETEGVLFPISLEKITRMYKGAIENGFASYAEA